MAVYPLLALVWALVLVPPMVRRRVDNRAEFAQFDRMRLSFVGSATTVSRHGRDDAQSPVRRSAIQRRRRVLSLIGAAMVATLVVALVTRTRVAWGMHLLVYDVLIGYVGLLARAGNKQPDRRVGAAPAQRPVVATPISRIPRTRPRSAPAPTAAPAYLQAASR